MIIKLVDTSFSLKYILALLNSKLLSKWFAIYFGKLSRKIFPQFKINELRIFPIVKSSTKSQITIENIINQILSLKSEGKDTTALEQQIDNLVYKLYELTYQEVKAIDPQFKLTESEYEAIKIE
jgi:CRISPR/Cas system-associated endonuclease/helicase Cas3